MGTYNNAQDACADYRVKNPAFPKNIGREQRFHGILGYEKLKDIDEKSARSALLHMFPWNKLPNYEKCSDMFFNRKDDYDFITNYIDSHKTTDEDLLIQLADSLANKDGIVTLEQRAKEYSERHSMQTPREMIEPRYKLRLTECKGALRKVYCLMN